MASLKIHQYWHRALTILVTVLIVGCSAFPTKEDEAKDSYEKLYRGSSENKTANEAAIAADTPEEAIARGDEAYRKRQYDIALYEYVDALKLNGGDTETLNKVGDIHYTLEDFDSAAAAYNASIQLEGENQHALLGLGLIQLRTRKYDQAKASLSKALAMDESSDLLWLAHNGLGTIADMQGDYPAAIVHYRNALQLNPGSAQVLNNLGYSEYLSGNWHAALMHFVQAVNSDRNFERAWYNIGLIYTRQGEYENAFDAFRNVLDTPQAYNDIGYLCMLDGYYDDAEEYYQKAVKTSPSYYLKAHENIDRLERIRDRGTTTQEIRRPPRSTPKTPVKEPDNNLQDTTIAVNEAGEPVVTIAPVSSTAVVDIIETTPASNTTSIENEKPGIPAKTSSATKEPGQSSLAEVSQPAAVSATPVDKPPVTSAETNPITTQSQIAENTVAPTADNQSINEISGSSTPTSTVNNSTSNPVIASVSTSDGSQSEPPANNTDTKQQPKSYNNQGEQAEYRRALAMVRDGEFEMAAESFNAFLDDYPESSYADNASYWIGETYYVTRDFEPALETFTSLVEKYPDSPKVPDTRLKIGYIHYEQHDWSAARETLNGIVSTYPDTEVAQLANARLKRMDDEAH